MLVRLVHMLGEGKRKLEDRRNVFITKR